MIRCSRAAKTTQYEIEPCFHCVDNKKDYKNVFHLGESKIDKLESYKYLGILFHKSNKFTKTRTMLYTQAQKAMYFILRQVRCLHVSIKIFYCMVLPMRLYGSEVWGVENVSLVGKVCNQYLKLLLPVGKSTPQYIIR